MDGQKVVFKGQWWLNFDYYAVVSGEGRFGWGKGGRALEIFGYDSPFLFSVFSNQPFFDIYSLEV